MYTFYTPIILPTDMLLRTTTHRILKNLKTTAGLQFSLTQSAESKATRLLSRTVAASFIPLETRPQRSSRGCSHFTAVPHASAPECRPPPPTSVATYSKPRTSTWLSSSTLFLRVSLTLSFAASRCVTTLTTKPPPPPHSNPRPHSNQTSNHKHSLTSNQPPQPQRHYMSRLIRLNY